MTGKSMGSSRSARPGRTGRAGAPSAPVLIRHAFTFAFAAILSCGIAVNTLDAVGVPTPAWMKAGADRSTLEARTYQELPVPTVQAIVSREYQTEAESFIADHMPARDAALLQAAALQRSLIALSAGTAGYESYPTYYGSEYLYCPSQDTILKVPYKATEDKAAAYDELASKINALASAYPEIGFVVCDMGEREYGEGDRRLPLSGERVWPAYVQGHFLEKLSPEIATVNLPQLDADGRHIEYYRSDHHWKTRSAFWAYTKCMEALDPKLDPIEATGYITWDDIDYQGSLARQGLMPVADPDHIDDVLYDASPLRVTVGEKKGDGSLLQHAREFAAHEVGTDRFASRYWEYFHDNDVPIEIANESAPSPDSLLIVSTSMADPTERFFAEHFRRVYRLNFRYVDESLVDFLATHDIDHVLLLSTDHAFIEESMLSFLDAGK